MPNVLRFIYVQGTSYVLEVPRVRNHAMMMHPVYELKVNLHAPVTEFSTQRLVIGRIATHTITGCLNSILLYIG